VKLRASTREQVADFLRCAADCIRITPFGNTPFSTAERRLSPDHRIRKLACRAWTQAWGDAWRRSAYIENGEPSFRLTLLEAAILVEEGSLPRTRAESLARRS